MLVDYDEAMRLYYEGKGAMEAGDLQTAVEKFKRSIDKAPHFKTPELMGECLLQLEKPTEAIVYLAAAAGLGNNEFRARYLLAKALCAVEDQATAVAKLEEALSINPNYRSAKELLETISVTEPSSDALADH